MAPIALISRDDDSNIIEGRARQAYTLDLGNQRFNAIAGAVGTFKDIVLPDLQAELLKEAQDNFINNRPMEADWHASSRNPDPGGRLSM